jgi:D-beta-D-heptose 7-phosphate kinase/D-beta-D-heptose 1-phosphate adenosyltransferase
LLSVVGADSEADVLLDRLRRAGVNVDDVRQSDTRSTLVKRRIVADGHLLLRFDQGTTSCVGGIDEASLLERLDEAHEWCDAIIISDYGYGIVTDGVRQRLATLQQRSPRIIAVDAKDYRLYRDIGIQAIKPNRTEALGMLGSAGALGDDLDRVLGGGPALLDEAGATLAAVTLDRDGALMLERGRTPHRVFARAAASPNTAGAGDTYMAALAVSLSCGASAPAAAELAGAAADVAVTKSGTAVCTLRELQCALAGEDKRVAKLDDVRMQIEHARAAGARLVMTSGCFDIIHRGHVVFLSQAKALGDLLVVALNADDGVARLKGPGRPINRLDDRAQVLAAMSCVDYVVPFAQETPSKLIQELRPDIYVKGGDYVREMVTESAVVESAGGQVAILPYVSDLSTTGVIHRVQRSMRRAARSPRSRTGAAAPPA